MRSPLHVARDGGVATLTLNRPEKRNALSIELRVALRAALAEVTADPRVRCAVLTGAGSAFCSGMDTTEFGGDAVHRQALVDASIGAFSAVARFPKPLLAAVNGPAVAGGFAVALWCDLRLIAAGAWMGFREPPGVPPSYAAARAALPAGLAQELCLTGRALSSEEALRREVVIEEVPAGALGERTAALAAEIAARPASATEATKRRILIERERVWGVLLDEEERALREALL